VSLIRYTSSKDKQFVYASLLIWSNDTTEITLGAPVSSTSTHVTLLGSDVGPLNWRSASESGGIIIDVSNIKIYSLASDWAWFEKLYISPKFFSPFEQCTFIISFNDEKFV
ncbi:unnamed protein product, partial [Rotaria sp. Silwood2]